VTDHEDCFLTSDLPESFIQLAAHVLHSYSPALIKITFRPGSGDSGRLIGSGTFVSVGKCFGVLTVHHVARLINELCEIGFTIVESLHRVTIDWRQLQVLHIAVPPVLGQGPDLAFIKIPWERALQISHYKHFYNLDFDREEMLSSPPPAHSTVWSVCGVPDELTLEGPPQGGFLQVPAFYGLCGMGGANRFYEEGGFDYIDSWVEYKGNDPRPSTFGGISGGGLWQVTYEGSPAGTISPRRYLLAGIPFAETPIRDSRRSIIYHGTKSVYEAAHAVIEAMCA